MSKTTYELKVFGVFSQKGSQNNTCTLKKYQTFQNPPICHTKWRKDTKWKQLQLT